MYAQLIESTTAPDRVDELSQVIRREEDIDALIDVNRTIMQGLSGQAEAA